MTDTGKPQANQRRAEPVSSDMAWCTLCGRTDYTPDEKRRGLCPECASMAYQKPRIGLSKPSVSKPVSCEEDKTRETTGNEHDENHQNEPNTNPGGVTPTATADEAEPTAGAGAREIVSAVYNRIREEGRWEEVAPIRNRMMAEARKQGMDKAAAQAWCYTELDRLYPPLPVKETPEKPAEPATGRVQGLGDIPASWGELPANASLQAELGWVQASRLLVVEETGSGSTVVHLGLARSPAPSMAALGWLETSIRSYAKYVDIVSRSLATQQDEQHQAQRERVRVEDVRALLREMDQ